MSGDDEDFRGAMERAYDPGAVPVARPAGPQQLIIDQRPKGAVAVEVKRDDAAVLRKIKTIAAAAGDKFFYRWPVKNKDGSTEWVEGPSVQCTNAVARIYGNNLAGCIDVQETPTHFIFTARFYDMETGYGYDRKFRQRKSANIGMKDKDRAEDIVFQIGQSKAIRNVVDNALSEYTNYAMLEAKEAIVSRIAGKPDVYRARLKQRLDDLKVDVGRVEAHIGRTIDKWLAPDMALVVAEIQTINDNMADPDELWPQKAIVVAATEPKKADFVKEDEKTAQTGTAETVDEKPAAEEQVDEIATQVGSAILLAHGTNGTPGLDLAALEQLDDQVSTITDRAGREDQRKRWNEAYGARKAAIADSKKAPPAETKTEEKTDPRQGLLDYIADKKKEVDAAKTTKAIDFIEDEVVRALGDPKDPDAKEFTAYCNAKARELSRRK